MKDFLLSDTGDLKIENGDFVVGTSDAQNQRLLLILPKGSIKEFPTATVGLSSFLETEDEAGMLREIRNRFTDDGMEIKQMGFDKDGNLLMDPQYK